MNTYVRLWFYADKELPEIASKLKLLGGFQEYLHDGEDTWEWCSSEFGGINALDEVKIEQIGRQISIDLIAKVYLGEVNKNAWSYTDSKIR
ncbi:hypothetical protein ACFQI7_37285 [Paenibacillus allorhizosphaerae]|uniref:Uncharacterized protein n=1 Tax=Paenibacillus allorhizosphaerae TaxID=2849866 RepID=A0ABM8VUT9_9BACL|nr:hypothetical protein [Paenibacillus allorhizosphaerae]CAG7659088.1 hypothetical protein PAECIP111802_07359 [Paenibacillus allorhizosphaerae]